MHSVFSLEVAIGIFTVKLYRDGLDAHLVAFLKVGDCHLVPVALAPAHVHPHQHRAPVVGFRAAGAGIDGQHRSEAVAFFAKHVAELEGFEVRDRL